MKKKKKKTLWDRYTQQIIENKWDFKMVFLDLKRINNHYTHVTIQQLYLISILKNPNISRI